MGEAFFLGLLLATAVAALFRPWIGVIGAYVLAVLTPQAVWWWNFQGLRPALWIMVPTLLGFAINYVAGNLRLQPALNKRSLYLAVMWLFFALSFYFGPYVNQHPLGHPAWVLDTFNKIFILYFVGCVCIDTPKKATVLAYVMAGTVIYFVYWANDMYLSGRMTFGRLGGPTGDDYRGVYGDENTFALLFVIGLPFLWHLGLAVKRNLLRWGLWLVIPFGWHAVFLTGSRGGLVGIGATLAITALRSKRKSLALLLIPAFVLAYQWQAGSLMQERAATLSSYETEGSAAGRLQAWAAATGMIKEHPLTGVGLGSFLDAFSDFSDNKIREAHNTFFQIAGESGLIAGLMYVLLVVACFSGLWWNGIRLGRLGTESRLRDLYWVNEATLVGFSGFVVCSLFLSLQMMEFGYYIFLLVNAILYVSRPQEASVAAALEPPVESGLRGKSAN